MIFAAFFIIFKVFFRFPRVTRKVILKIMIKCLFIIPFSTFKMSRRQNITNKIKETLGGHVSEHLQYFCRKLAVTASFCLSLNMCMCVFYDQGQNNFYGEVSVLETGSVPGQFSILKKLRLQLTVQEHMLGTFLSSLTDPVENTT